jgi:hypothetical protein
MVIDCAGAGVRTRKGVDVPIGDVPVGRGNNGGSFYHVCLLKFRLQAFDLGLQHNELVMHFILLVLRRSLILKAQHMVPQGVLYLGKTIISFPFFQL